MLLPEKVAFSKEACFNQNYRVKRQNIMAKVNIEISLLQAMLPDYSPEHLRYLRNRLQGQNTFEIWTNQSSDPIEFIVEIGDVALLPEAEPAIPYLKSEGLISEQDSDLTGVIDIGGGTAIYYLVDNNGVPLSSSRKVVNLGTKALFENILANEEFRQGCEPLGSISDASILQKRIIQALEISKIKGTPLSLIYARNNQFFDWTHIYDKLTRDWLNLIIGSSQSHWKLIDGAINSLQQVVHIGGGAHIINQFIKPEDRSWLLIPSEPQLASVLGAAISSSGSKVATVDPGNRMIKSIIPGQRNAATLDSKVAILESVPRNPMRYIPEDTFVVRYSSGPCLIKGKQTEWIKAFGVGAKSLNAQAVETHASIGKERIYDYLSIAGIVNSFLNQKAAKAKAA